jgi:hypothetical protein
MEERRAAADELTGARKNDPTHKQTRKFPRALARLQTADNLSLKIFKWLHMRKAPEMNSGADVSRSKECSLD